MNIQNHKSNQYRIIQAREHNSIIASSLRVPEMYNMKDEIRSSQILSKYVRRLNKRKHNTVLDLNISASTSKTPFHEPKNVVRLRMYQSDLDKHFNNKIHKVDVPEGSLVLYFHMLKTNYCNWGSIELFKGDRGNDYKRCWKIIAINDITPCDLIRVELDEDSSYGILFNISDSNDIDRIDIISEDMELEKCCSIS